MKTKVINLLNEIRPEFDFGEDVNYIEQGMLDSFDIVILVTALEEKFETTIDGMDILPENFATSDAIVKLLNKKGVH
jgi:acyl carrier protein